MHISFEPPMINSDWQSSTDQWQLSQYYRQREVVSKEDLLKQMRSVMKTLLMLADMGLPVSEALGWWIQTYDNVSNGRFTE